MTSNLPRLGANVNDALTRLDTFRPTEAAVLRREITRLRRTIANRIAATVIVPGDILDLASIIDTTRRHYPHPNVPPRHYADAIVSAGWQPPKGTG